MCRFWIVPAILGVVALVASFTLISSYKGAMLGIVLGGLLVQAGIAAFAINFGQEKRSSRKRRYRHGMTPAASANPASGNPAPATPLWRSGLPRASAQLGKILFPKFARAASRGAGAVPPLGAAQLDAPDFAGNRLR